MNVYKIYYIFVLQLVCVYLYVSQALNQSQFNTGREWEKFFFSFRFNLSSVPLDVLFI